MNRYRPFAGQRPSQASPSTTCQKCLQKDSYECKASAQDRPYTSRPSRTQQLSNPSLKPRLTNDKSNELLRKEGIADQVLAQAQAQRDAIANSIERSQAPLHGNPLPIRTSKSRTHSRSSSRSISTISTRKSGSMSPPQRGDKHRPASTATHPRKRTHSQRSPPSRSSSRSSPASHSRSPPPHTSHHHHHRSKPHKSRRYGSTSPPHHRGRPTSERRGSHRDRSADQSVAKRDSAALKGRKSLEIHSGSDDDDGYDERRGADRSHHRNTKTDDDRRGRGGAGGGDRHVRERQQRRRTPPPPRKRSLSPFSKRLALTQAMNMAR